MSTLAQRLDQKLKSLSPEKAASVERLFWDVLQVVEEPLEKPVSSEEAIQKHESHIDKCLALAAEMDWSEFERPEQGTTEKREDW